MLSKMTLPSRGGRRWSGSVVEQYASAASGHLGTTFPHRHPDVRLHQGRRIVHPVTESWRPHDLSLEQVDRSSFSSGLTRAKTRSSVTSASAESRCDWANCTAIAAEDGPAIPTSRAMARAVFWMIAGCHHDTDPGSGKPRRRPWRYRPAVDLTARQGRGRVISRRLRAARDHGTGPLRAQAPVVLRPPIPLLC